MKAKLIKRAGLVVILSHLGTAMVSGQTDKNLINYFREYIGLSDVQIADVAKGTGFVKEIPSPNPAEIILFGAVFVKALPENYLRLLMNVDAQRKLPNFLAIQPFSTPPQLSDLRGFTLDSEDIEDLRVCVPGSCKVQLPAEEIERFRNSVDWSAQDAADQANGLAQKMALEALLAYQQGGDSTLGVYRDQRNPTQVSEEFQQLVSQLKSLPVYLPELRDYLLGYPKTGLSGMEDQFFWEKITFGLRPTIRLVHAMLYQNPGHELAFVYAEKKIYSSHYFHTALELTACAEAPDQAGFFLITVKASQQSGLTGIKGSVVRPIAVERARTLLESALTGIKKSLEDPSAK